MSKFIIQKRIRSWTAESPYYEDRERREVLEEIACEIHENAIDKGWWEEARNPGEMIALIHSELSEALEAIRHGNPPDDKIPNFNGAVAELVDAIIRCLDMAYAAGWPIGDAIVAKMAFNSKREYKHGGKEF